MKIAVTTFLIIMSLNCFCQEQLTLTYKTFDFNINIPNLKAGGGLNGWLCNQLAGSVLYKVNGRQHIITGSADSTSPQLHFITDKDNWVFENYYPEAAVSGGNRNYNFVDSIGTVAFASTGSEAIQPWLNGDLFIAKTIDTKLKWTKVSDVKSFYHSLGVGDLNGDSLFDVAGIHMGSYGNWGEEPQIYFQNPDGSFSETRNFLDVSSYSGMNNGLGAGYIGHLLNKKRPEIVLAEYGFNPNSFGSLVSNRKGFGVFSFDETLNKYVYQKGPTALGAFSNITHGATSIKSGDFNNDGKADLAIATEGFPGPRIQIWNGDGNGAFNPGQELFYGDTTIAYSDSTTDFREFEVMDFNKDGWLDIVVHPYNFGNAFRLNQTKNSPMGDGIILQNCIWENKKGQFEKIKNKLIIPNYTPGYMKGFFIDDKLRFFGFEEDKHSPRNTNAFKLIYVTINVCNNLVRPIFNSQKYSFCAGDTLKLSITNTNKGDTLKWYYGNKSDITNVNNKMFTDSTSLYVTRTDSLGCVISSDTINLIKYTIPRIPTLSRDTSNYLVASINGINWFKDGLSLPDTTQKYKPVTAGAYTIKTTQNGCTSLLSSPYYYLVTDILNLSSNEYIKLAPNPFGNQVNFDFLIKGYQKLNIDVFEMTTGNKNISFQNLTPGMPIYLGQLLPGTYLIKVSSTDNKIAYLFKMVKI